VDSFSIPEGRAVSSLTLAADSCAAAQRPYLVDLGAEALGVLFFSVWRLAYPVIDNLYLIGIKWD